MDRHYRSLFAVYNGVFTYGSAAVDYDSSVLKWSAVTNGYSDIDLMYFGLSSIELGPGK